MALLLPLLDQPSGMLPRCNCVIEGTDISGGVIFVTCVPCLEREKDVHLEVHSEAHLEVHSEAYLEAYLEVHSEAHEEEDALPPPSMFHCSCSYYCSEIYKKCHTCKIAEKKKVDAMAAQLQNQAEQNFVATSCKVLGPVEDESWIIVDSDDSWLPVPNNTPLRNSEC
jgi:hypothetical protein